MDIQPAQHSQISTLTAISKRAFDSDILVGAPGVGGPPDYDSEPWHEKMMAGRHLYAICHDGRLMGGIILFPDRKDEKNMFIGRIFLDPSVHRQGLGLAAMKQLEAVFPQVRHWALDTPVWNTRTIPFYKRLGYAEAGRDGEMVFFRKDL